MRDREKPHKEVGSDEAAGDYACDCGAEGGVGLALLGIVAEKSRLTNSNSDEDGGGANRNQR